MDQARCIRVPCSALRYREVVDALLQQRLRARIECETSRGGIAMSIASSGPLPYRLVCAACGNASGWFSFHEGQIGAIARPPTEPKIEAVHRIVRSWSARSSFAANARALGANAAELHTWNALARVECSVHGGVARGFVMTVEETGAGSLACVPCCRGAATLLARAIDDAVGTDVSEPPPPPRWAP